MPNIKENLLQMKDMSELMIDLAYTAVFLKDKAIASEVSSLSEKIRLLEKDILRMSFKIRETDDARIFLIELTDFIKDLSNTAVNIAGLCNTKNYPPIVSNILKESNERIISESIKASSSLAGKTIGESRIKTYTKARIIAVKRKEQWIFDTNAGLRLQAKDMVVAVGGSEAEKLLKDYAEGKLKIPK